MLPESFVTPTAGILTYGITPPKKDLPEDRILAISAAQTERIRGLGVDALVLYDIADERERNSEERPFPFLETVDPLTYGRKYLTNLSVPQIVYRSVGKYKEEDLADFVRDPGSVPMTVFVGAASTGGTGMSLARAYEIYAQNASDLLLGGVLIPERHAKYADEHLRVRGKIQNGCRFFISQAVYNVSAAKDFLSDYAMLCRTEDLQPVPILFTLTPCGSAKTLQFMKWLGIAIPRWIENDLSETDDILGASVDASEAIFRELWSYARQKHIPIGCNVESVSTRKIEIDASVDLLYRVREIMGHSEV